MPLCVSSSSPITVTLCFLYKLPTRPGPDGRNQVFYTLFYKQFPFWKERNHISTAVYNRNTRLQTHTSVYQSHSLHVKNDVQKILNCFPLLVTTTNTSVKFYQIKRHNIPQDNVHIITDESSPPHTIRHLRSILISYSHVRLPSQVTTSHDFRVKLYKHLCQPPRPIKV